MTIDLFLRDASGRVLASVADNPEIPAVPAKACAHGVLCPACGGRES
jgi:hypothetical protein